MLPITFRYNVLLMRISMTFLWWEKGEFKHLNLGNATVCPTQEPRLHV